MAKERLDIMMQNRGLAESRTLAQKLIMAGEVRVNGNMVIKPSQQFTDDVEITVDNGPQFVSRGGEKLLGALQAFDLLDVNGAVCADVGASTGGFTDCLLKAGAACVYAVDVGYGQLMGSLRQDPRVINLERTNISDEKLLSLEPRPTLGSVDLSYLSLLRGVPAFSAVLHGQGELVCLVKPLFETEDAAARRSGILPDNAYVPVLLGLIDKLSALPETRVLNVTHSPVTGNAGTREFFLHILLGSGSGSVPGLDKAAAIAVERALALTEYEKRR